MYSLLTSIGYRKRKQKHIKSKTPNKVIQPSALSADLLVPEGSANPCLLDFWRFLSAERERGAQWDNPEEKKSLPRILKYLEVLARSCGVRTGATPPPCSEVPTAAKFEVRREWKHFVS